MRSKAECAQKAEIERFEKIEVLGESVISPESRRWGYRSSRQVYPEENLLEFDPRTDLPFHSPSQTSPEHNDQLQRLSREVRESKIEAKIRGHSQF